MDFINFIERYYFLVPDIMVVISTQINVSKIEALSAFWKNWKGINETQFTRLKIKYTVPWFIFWWESTCQNGFSHSGWTQAAQCNTELPTIYQWRSYIQGQHGELLWKFGPIGQWYWGDWPLWAWSSLGTWSDKNWGLGSCVLSGTMRELAELHVGTPWPLMNRGYKVIVQ